jgi:hypothetical protein
MLCLKYNGCIGKSLASNEWLRDFQIRSNLYAISLHPGAKESGAFHSAEEFRVETQDSRWQKLKGGVSNALDSAKEKGTGLFSRPIPDENLGIADELD